MPAIQTQTFSCLFVIDVIKTADCKAALVTVPTNPRARSDRADAIASYTEFSVTDFGVSLQFNA